MMSGINISNIVVFFTRNLPLINITDSCLSDLLFHVSFLALPFLLLPLNACGGALCTWKNSYDRLVIHHFLPICSGSSFGHPVDNSLLLNDVVITRLRDLLGGLLLLFLLRCSKGRRDLLFFNYNVKLEFLHLLQGLIFDFGNFLKKVADLLGRHVSKTAIAFGLGDRDFRNKHHLFILRVIDHFLIRQLFL